MSVDTIARGLALQAQASFAHTVPQLQPVATGSQFPFQVPAAGGTQFGFRTMHFVPNGAKSVRLLFSSVYAGAIETPTTTGFPLKVAVAIEPAPWNATKTYNPGDIVLSYAPQFDSSQVFDGKPYYICSVANTNSRPVPSNANWTQSGVAFPTRIPVTISGFQDASFLQQTTAFGSIAGGTGGVSSTTLTVTSVFTPNNLQVGDSIAGTTIQSFGTGTGGTGTYNLATAVTIANGTNIPVFRAMPKGLILTDPIPLVFPVGSWMGVYTWMPCGAGQVIVAEGQAQNPALGGTLTSGSAVPDITAVNIGTAGMQQGSSGSLHMRPAAIIGQPLIPCPGVAIIGDSIAQGKDGSSNAIMTLVSGGSGYKVGDLLGCNPTGGSAGAFAAGSAITLFVDKVDGSGVILALRSVDGGAFTNTATQTGVTLPSGTQNLTGGSGSGATASIAFGTNAYDVGDALGGQGWIERALNAAGIPYVSFAAAADRADLWTGTRAMTRYAALALCGAKNAFLLLGRNDLSVNDTAATLLANNQAIANGSSAAKVFIGTITPEVTSTTAAGTSTLGSQNVTSNDPARQAYNSNIRANYSTLGFAGLIDVAAAIEDGGAVSPSGKFSVIAGLPSSADGKHPGPSAIALLQAAITPVISALT